MTTTRERKRPVKAAAKPQRKRTPARHAAPRPSTNTDLGYGLTLHNEHGDRFMALPETERERIVDDFMDYVRRAMDGTTMEEYRTERRREAERD
jgi:hypothetical protein